MAPINDRTFTSFSDASHSSARRQQSLSLTNPPMKTKHNPFTCASALHISFISLLAVSLTLSAAPLRNQRERERESAGTNVREAGTLQKKSLTSPIGLKPVEREAWLA